MGNKIVTYEYNSWNDFKVKIFQELYYDSVFSRNKYLFRGQSNPEWSLISTFDRNFRDKRLASSLLNNFKNECEKYELVSDEILKEDSKMLALGQHNGLPTRLLDWTESIYIAAFFAFTNANNSNDIKDKIAIWILNNDELIWSQENGIKIIEVPSIGNIRLRNQSGKFTLLNSTFNTLEEHINNITINDYNKPILIKCLIPSSDAKMVIAELNSMDIDYFKLFPELYGIALNSKMKVIYDI